MELIQQRIREYQAKTKEEELNAYKEICQEIALAALARADFFNKGSFQGGTALRILHQLDRFSEDLDFALQEPDPDFIWSPYFHAMEEEFSAHGLKLKVEDRSKGTNVVKKAFLKEDSFGQILFLQNPLSRADSQTIRIKLEIDTNPPDGGECTTHLINFPYPFSVVSDDLSTLFSGKCLAILCRKYVKGRDWYDLLWYLRRQVGVNYAHITSGLKQNGNFPHTPSIVDRDWLLTAFSEKIQSIDWELAKKDIQRFIRPDRQHVIKDWSSKLFLEIIKSLP